MPPKSGTTPGRFIRQRRGYAAFIPDPLPPTLAWTPELLALLSDADRLIGRLAGEGRLLPNPHLLIRPFIQREAVYSSRIEGTQATLGELLAVDAGLVVDRSPADLREVGNYVAALEHGVARLSRLPLSLRLVRELHAKLMDGVRGNVATPGAFRRSQNWVGRPGGTLQTATYVPPPPHELMRVLGEWEKFLHDRTGPPLVHAALLYYQFEAIHPFLDGNGRVGRLLITLFLIARGVLPTPLLYLSAFFEAQRRTYYDRLLGVTMGAAWEAWLTFFLTGVVTQASDALARAEQINHQIHSWRQRLAGSASRVPLQLLDLLIANPFISATRAAKQLDIAFTTAQRGIGKLAAAGVLVQLGPRKRDRVYCARSLLDILERPAPTEVASDSALRKSK